MLGRLEISLIGAVMFACGGQKATDASPSTADTPPAESSAGKGTSIDLDALLARESSGLAEQAVTDANGAFSAKVLGAAAPVVQKAEGALVFEIPIGAQASVRCQVFAEDADPGGTIAGLFAATSKQLEFVRVEPAGVKVVAGAPAQYIHALYVAPGKNGKAAGQLKLAFQARDASPILCLHDEVGYRSTFERVSESFFASFAGGAAPPKPKYREVMKTRLDDTDIGFGVTRVLAGEKPGELLYMYQSATFVPTSPKDLIIEDDVHVLTLDSKGQLVKGVWVKSDAGELSLQVTVTRAERGLYRYEGQVSGKPVQGELRAKKSLATPLDAVALLKRKLKNGQPFQEQLEEYHPALDPGALLPVTYSREKGSEPRAVRVTVGQQQMTANVDEQGQPEAVTMGIGGKTLRLVREHREGSL